jgi:hypothetical protein
LPLTTLQIVILSVVRGESTINPVFNPKPMYLLCSRLLQHCKLLF